MKESSKRKITNCQSPWLNPDHRQVFLSLFSTFYKSEIVAKN